LEGISALNSIRERQDLPALLAEDPQFWFGAQNHAAQTEQGIPVLWKFLDSSVRLQIQAHPDKAFARRHLNSQKGKTECWHILSTRGGAHVYLGFQNPPTRGAWARIIQEQNVDAMLACFEPIPVRPGETYTVPAGTPHAIGEGVFMLELQEPTDWVVRCETVNAGLRLPTEACFMGLDLETCLDVFDYGAWPIEKVRGRLQQPPKTTVSTSSFCEEELISPAFHEYFRLHRLSGAGEATWRGQELMLLIALRGKGSLSLGSDSQVIESGQTWLLPGAADQWRWLEAKGDWEILLAKLPIGHHRL
jgi:mannose-6-phosphate isomerase